MGHSGLETTFLDVVLDELKEPRVKSESMCLESGDAHSLSGPDQKWDQSRIRARSGTGVNATPDLDLLVIKMQSSI